MPLVHYLIHDVILLKLLERLCREGSLDMYIHKAVMILLKKMFVNYQYQDEKTHSYLGGGTRIVLGFAAMACWDSCCLNQQI